MTGWVTGRPLLPFCALAVVAVYLLLSVSAASCLFAHQPASSLFVQQHAEPHQHSGSTAHASFCAWACQANPTVDRLPVAPQTDSLRVCAWLAPLLVGLAFVITWQSVPSRAPPRR